MRRRAASRRTADCILRPQHCRALNRRRPCALRLQHRSVAWFLIERLLLPRSQDDVQTHITAAILTGNHFAHNTIAEAIHPIKKLREQMAGNRQTIQSLMRQTTRSHRENALLTFLLQQIGSSRKLPRRLDICSNATPTQLLQILDEGR